MKNMTMFDDLETPEWSFSPSLEITMVGAGVVVGKKTQARILFLLGMDTASGGDICNEITALQDALNDAGVVWYGKTCLDGSWVVLFASDAVPYCTIPCKKESQALSLALLFILEQHKSRLT